MPLDGQTEKTASPSDPQEVPVAPGEKFTVDLRQSRTSVFGCDDPDGLDDRCCVADRGRYLDQGSGPTVRLVLAARLNAPPTVWL